MRKCQLHRSSSKDAVLGLYDPHGPGTLGGVNLGIMGQHHLPGGFGAAQPPGANGQIRINCMVQQAEFTLKDAVQAASRVLPGSCQVAILQPYLHSGIT
jgi:hypothetical protein